MPALSARHIASSALCASLLVGITGPAAMAADSAHERSPAAASPHDARLARMDALLANVRKINGGELAPVADLLDAVLRADDGRLPPAEAERLGAAAKRALAEASAKAPAPSVTPTATAPATLMLPSALSAPADDELADLDEVADAVDDVLDQVGDVLDDVVEAVDSLLEELTSGVGDVLPEADDLLTALENLVKALLGVTAEEATSSDPAASGTQTSTATPPASPVTLPVIGSLLQGLQGLLPEL